MVFSNTVNSGPFKRFLVGIPLVALLVFPILSQTITYYETGEEFNGPFSTWKNVKTDFGANNAKGDGTTDDAAAINAALLTFKTNLRTATSSVLYFPAGTYKINSTISTTRTDAQNDYFGLTIIGEDPATTVIQWGGASGQNMFKLDSWYCKVGRMTFDGKSTANVGILRDGGFSTYCEMDDLFFKDMQVGIQLAGPSDLGQAEHAIERCRFSRCTYGITTPNFNTMDIYIWYCLFEDCGTGVHNFAGGYQAFENVFLRSTVADLGSQNNMVFNIVNNTSINSKCFLGSFAGQAHVQGNKIYSPINRIALPGNGVATFIGNTIRSRASGSGACVTVGAGNHLFVDNTFTISNPIGTGGRNFNANQKIVDSSTIPVPTVVRLPGTPPNKHRTILEVRKATGNDASEIQKKVLSACSLSVYGANPVIHIPKGNYSFSTTVVIPRNVAMQLIGDEGTESGSRIAWSGTGTGPCFRLMGPSRVTMRDIGIFTTNTSAGLLTIENADQIGGRIFADQVVCSGNSSSQKCNTSIFVDMVENSDITFINGGWGEYTTAGVLVKGGRALAKGEQRTGQISMLLGALGNNENKLIDVQNGGRVLAYGFRDEMPTAGSIINLGTGSSGTISIAGMSWAGTPSLTVPFMNINGFNGTLAYVGNSMGKGYAENSGSFFFQIAGSGSNSRVLNAANDFRSQNSISITNTWKDVSNPKAYAAMLNCFGGPVNGSTTDISNVVNQITNSVVDTQVVLSMLSQIRSLRIEPPIRRPDSTTDVKLIRMMCRIGADGMGIVIKADTTKDTLVGVMNGVYQGYRSAFRSIERVSIGGKGFTISPLVTSIMVFDAMGRIMWTKKSIKEADLADVMQNIMSYSRKGVFFVQMEK